MTEKIVNIRATLTSKELVEWVMCEYGVSRKKAEKLVADAEKAGEFPPYGLE